MTKILRPICLMVALTLVLSLGAILASPAARASPGKSLYVIADINQDPTPIEAYDIQAAPNYLVYQASHDVPSYVGGAVGLAIDSASATLFVTYEGFPSGNPCNTIQLVDAITFADLGTATAPGAENWLVLCMTTTRGFSIR